MGETASLVWMLSQGGLPGGEGEWTLGFRMAGTKRLPVREPGPSGRFLAAGSS